MIVYVLTMQRWGDSENHSYVSAVHSTLREALIDGISHHDHRGGMGKYQPRINSCYVDGSHKEPIRTICESIEEARKLLYDMDNAFYDEWDDIDYESIQCPFCRTFKVKLNDTYYSCDKCDYCWKINGGK